MINIGEYKIKKNNSYQTRLKAIEEVFTSSNIGDANRIQNTISPKFIQEKINLKTKEVEQVIKDFIRDTPILAQTLAKGDSQTISQYINQI